MDKRVLSYIALNQSRFLSELAEFVRFPTVAGQMEHASDMNACAAWLAKHLRSIGLECVEVISTAGHPIVYAEWPYRGNAPTVLIYGHYDVQPADPLSEWKSPPFEPIVRGSNLYGRGACDDKGQLFTHVKALECYLATLGELPVNVKCLFEGEEEIGSPSLHSFMTSHGCDLSADAAVISDMPMPAPDRPAITYSLRGALSLELEATGHQHDLHSGIYGGAVDNPAHILCEILAQLHSPDGRIAIPGFYDRVRTWDIDERTYMARIGPQDSEILWNARVSRGWGEPGFTTYERTTIRPSLSVNAITAGYQGAGPMAIIPSRAVAKLSFRLVPDQDPGEIERLFRQFVSAVRPPWIQTNIRTQFKAAPMVVDRNHPTMQSAARAYLQGFGARPVFLRSGGTIPVASMLKENLDIPVLGMGFALPDDQMHAPNEKFYLPNFFNGIRTSIHFLNQIVSSLQPLERARELEIRQIGIGDFL